MQGGLAPDVRFGLRALRSRSAEQDATPRQRVGQPAIRRRWLRPKHTRDAVTARQTRTQPSIETCLSLDAGSMIPTAARADVSLRVQRGGSPPRLSGRTRGPHRRAGGEFSR